MTEQDEECELTHLVQPETDGRITIKAGEATPPITPTICKVAATPSSPTSNKVSSSGGGSLHGGNVCGTSHGSLSSRNKVPGPSLTPIGLSGGNGKFLYVEKLSNLSRRQSLLSDASCRTPKDGKPNACMSNSIKKELPLGSGDNGQPTVPPNTPSPSGWRNQQSNISTTNICDENQSDSQSHEPSSASSRMTTKALASESETLSQTKTSSETLKKMDKCRPHMPFESNSGTLTCSPSAPNFGSSGALNYIDYVNHLKTSYSGIRPLNSSSKSKGNNKNQKTIQHHSFLSDSTDVRQMEHALLQLLEDFHSGKLRAFAKDCSMEQMQGIREQQERLARLHFDLGAQQELYAPLSEEGLRANQENMHKLMGSLEQLSLSIEKLQLFSKDVSQ